MPLHPKTPPASTRTKPVEKVGTYFYLTNPKENAKFYNLTLLGVAEESATSSR